MPLVTDYGAVKEIYQEAAARGVSLPSFCVEDRETLEAILAGALDTGKEIGLDDLPVVPAWTCRYPGRGQMGLLTACGDPVLGTNLMLSDLQAFMGDTSPYRKLRVLPHLDHGFPWLDGDIMRHYTDRFASIMCDASEKPFEANVHLTAQYVDEVRGRVLVEGAVDEIFESGSDQPKNEPTTVEQAEHFLRETGVDILVPNVGTEHRSTATRVAYCSDRAKDISTKVGKILCLHGTSSLRSQDLSRLPADGFVKVNIFTVLAVRGGQAVARMVINNVGNILDERELKSLVQADVLGKRTLEPDFGETQPPLKPKLDFVATPRRRDAWFSAVRETCRQFYKVLNYRAFQD
jgi:fructose/tagatose bisphosphate aldolase